MIKRTLYFSNPARLSKKDSQLLVQFPEESGQESRTVPIEDIGIIVLDHSQITFTQALLSSLLENNAAVMCTDSRHLPGGMFLNFQGHSEMAERYAFQIDASLPLKKFLWQQTVEQKILNQAAMLSKYGEKYEDLVALAKLVKSGDPENMEGRTAALYWKRLFKGFDLHTESNGDIHARTMESVKEDFKRGRNEAAPNNLLNYGYAILRAVVARSICGSGLLPTLGIHHRNKYNPFCLADDIMEPYRPYVDGVVCLILEAHGATEELTPALKKELLQIPTIDVVIDGESSPLMVAMQRTTASLARCYEGVSRKILYPQMK